MREKFENGPKMMKRLPDRHSIRAHRLWDRRDALGQAPADEDLRRALPTGGGNPADRRVPKPLGLGQRAVAREDNPEPFACRDPEAPDLDTTPPTGHQSARIIVQRGKGHTVRRDGGLREVERRENNVEGIVPSRWRRWSR